jgi:hypothetical protein
MQNKFLNTDRRTFIIKFQNRSTNGRFIFQEPEELVELLKDFDFTSGIEFIKEFQPYKLNFVKVSKEDLLKFCSWNTDAIEYLKNHYYFKK